ncbi:BRO family protein [Candidatus Allofournierella merdipullorum]|uniref:BRO family protein n=1 Tax=Candidatus Allofournierella merdipullorum TaxID=2838595 RepID=UPI00374E636D
MNELMIFENPEFGRVRSVEIDGEPWLVGKDVAQALGYSNTKDAISAHVDEEDRRILQRSEIATIENHIPKSALPMNFVRADVPNRGLTVINESGLYSLVLSSKLPGAKQFRRWVTSEVLPAIRKKGGYTHEPKSAMEMLRLQSQAMFELDDRMTALEEKVDNQMTIDHGQQRQLQRAVSARVLERVATVIPARMVRECKPMFFSALYRDLKDRFGVPSYRDVRVSDYPDAIAYINNWVEPAELRRKGA